MVCRIHHGGLHWSHCTAEVDPTSAAAGKGGCSAAQGRDCADVSGWAEKAAANPSVGAAAVGAAANDAIDGTRCLGAAAGDPSAAGGACRGVDACAALAAAVCLLHTWGCAVSTTSKDKGGTVWLGGNPHVGVWIHVGDRVWRSSTQACALGLQGKEAAGQEANHGWILVQVAGCGRRCVCIHSTAGTFKIDYVCMYGVASAYPRLLCMWGDGSWVYVCMWLSEKA